jgi:signal transduction histidine kinase
MERFRARPEDPEARLKPSGRNDEIGRAEVELNQMQEDLLAALHSRARMVALGEAVAKINHDLRNMLTSAQFASDRLASSGDPQVAQALPRLERALGRAVRLAEGVLAYGKSEEAAPTLQTIDLNLAAADAAEDAGLVRDAEPREGMATLVRSPSLEIEVQADSDQLHRIFVNLFRNARQAIETNAGAGRAGAVTVSAIAAAEVVRIRIADNGPGLPERARARLFQAFSGSQRPDGAGLGLAIARELAAGHGGDLTLIRSDADGAEFELVLPVRPDVRANADVVQ